MDLEYVFTATDDAEADIETLTKKMSAISYVSYRGSC